MLVIGGSILDLKCRSAHPLQSGTSNPGRVVRTAGGVGRNIAENLARLGTPTTLVTALGNDADGEFLLHASRSAGVCVDHVIRMDEPTGRYVAILDSDGELAVAVSDMAATEAIQAYHLLTDRDLMNRARLVVLDGNLPPDSLGAALDAAATAGVPVLLDPVSTAKAERLAPLLEPRRPVRTLTPNRRELEAICGVALASDDAVGRAAGGLHERGVDQVWVRMGERGSLLSLRRDGALVQHVLPVQPAVPADEIRDVTGAGDSALAAFAHALLQEHGPLAAARLGHAAAAFTIGSAETVRTDMSFALLEALLHQDQETP